MTAKQMDSVTPLDLLSNKNYTSRKIRDARYGVCLTCDNLNSLFRSCNECGCFMSLKTWLKDADCPIGAWEGLSNDDQ